MLVYLTYPSTHTCHYSPFNTHFFILFHTAGAQLESLPLPRLPTLPLPLPRLPTLPLPLPRLPTLPLPRLPCGLSHSGFN